MKKLLRSWFWRIVLRMKGATCGKNVRFNGPVHILLRDGANASNIIIEKDVVFGGQVYLRLRKNGKIILKNGVKTGIDTWLVSANDSELIIGKNTILGSYNILNAGHGLKIGDHCIFANFVYVNTSDHNYKKGKLIQNQGFFGDKIEVGDDVWLGGFVFVNKGVKIGDGAVVGAGSIVVKDIPSYSIAAGNPAQVIKKRE